MKKQFFIGVAVGVLLDRFLYSFSLDELTPILEEANKQSHKKKTK